MDKFVRIRTDKGVSWGITDGARIELIDNAPWHAYKNIGETVPFEYSSLASPVIPSKLVFIGLNYKDHIKDIQLSNGIPDEPIIFMKPPTAVIGPNDDIPHYSWLDRIDFEGELAAVIGKKIFRANPHQARDSILGFTCVNDITARNVQRKDGQWTRAKSFDGFCPVGPWISVGIDPLDLLIETRVDDVVKQSSRTSQQIWNIYELVAFISGIMTLFPGDLISSGTPLGTGPLAPGDQVSVTIQDIGTLKNGVVYTS
ncbi:MAG: hypothetical protein A2W25_07100 [candidate division Zixibacteria bacterium RBG_16_53_22]|nr:MAG: hypothetical protein A2W25_07100 [candidate division Zixibacteria bacterium RBG_16_53_22]